MSIGHHDDPNFFDLTGLKPMTMCIDCKVPKPEREFQSRRSEKYRTHAHRTRCRDCTSARERRRYIRDRTENYFHFKAIRAKSRSQWLKVPFNLTGEYLESIWTDFCPVFGIPLEKWTDRQNEGAVELDRKTPSLGYVQGNVVFMSRKANRLKNNAAVDDLRRLLSWMDSNV